MTEEKLLSCLNSAGAGRKRAIKSCDLERSLGCSGNELRKQVNKLRRNAVPIGSNREGYFFALSAGEVYSTINHLKKMVRGLEAAISGLEKSLDEFGSAASPTASLGGDDL